MYSKQKGGSAKGITTAFVPFYDSGKKMKQENKENSRNGNWMHENGNSEDMARRIYLLAMGVLFPFFITRYYSNIQNSKSLFFSLISLTFFLPVVFETFGGKKKKAFGYFRKAEFYVLFFFLVTCLVSSVFSDYPKESFFGTAGRSMGWIFILSCGLCFYISSFTRENDIKICIPFLAAGTIVSFIGILNFMGINIFGFVNAVPEYARGRYLSTIGYANFFSEYLSLICIMGIVYYVLYRKIYMLFLLYFLYLGILIGNSDCGIVALLCVVLLFPLFFHKTEGWFRFALISGLPAMPACITAHFLYRFSKGAFMDNGLPAFLCGIRGMIFLFVALGFLLLADTVVRKKQTRGMHRIPQWIQKICPVLAIAVMLILFGGYLLNNQGIRIFKEWNVADEFANYRGYIWKNSLWIYRGFPLKSKLFGYGPDTLRILYENTLGADMLKKTGQIYDSAHNIVLQYLLSTGGMGVCLLLSFVGIVLFKSLKEKEENRLLFLLPLIGYLIQSLFVPSSPMVTPFCFLFAGLCNTGSDRIWK